MTHQLAATDWSDTKGRIAVVTGGASGIGRSMAMEFIAQGMQVVIADIEETALNKTAAEIGAIPFRVDVTKLEDLTALRDFVQEKFGTVDILCNNAGVGGSTFIDESRPDDWRWVVNVNLLGVAYGLTLFLPMLEANPRGSHIVNTTSIGGFVSYPTSGIYSATKAAVAALSESLELEMAIKGKRVGVTLLAPGGVRTNIFSSNRNRPPELTDVNVQDVDIETDPVFMEQVWMDPSEVGPIVMDAIRRGALYVTTNPPMADEVEVRMVRLLKELRVNSQTLQAAG